MVPLTVSFIALTVLTYFGLACQSSFLVPDAVVEALASPSSLSQRGTSSRNNKLLIIGLGRVGLQVANLAIEKETIQVFGTVQQSSLRKGNIQVDGGDSTSSENEIVRIPFEPVIIREHLFGCNDDKTTDDYSVVEASHVLFTVPLKREDDPLMDAVLKDLREWWNKEEERKGRDTNESDYRCHAKVLGILSTTGVYGHHDGKVVTENCELLCEESSNAELYRKFEDDWISLSAGDVVKEDDMVGSYHDTPRGRHLCIFRCAGIYDSSRSALHTVFKNIQSPTPTYISRKSASSTSTAGSKTNRIHSVDLARGVLSGMFQQGNKNDGKHGNSEIRIYNLADNLPEARSVVLSHARELLASIGFDERKFGAENETSEMTETTKIPAASDRTMLSRSSITRQRRREKESKLVCNKRMREELLPDDGLLFPTYREGLHAIFIDPSTPWQQQNLLS